MSWPMSQDFNEAIQNPKQAFGDPDLQTGEPVVGAHGLPLPRSGNFADVYQLRGADSREWAVKCFTRPVTGLGDRYAAISEALAEANFPFSVGFEFLGEGIKVGGIGRPVVKMEWVEGLLLNHVVRENAGSPKVLSALGQMWVKLCKRLREAGVAHADLQHGNVLLVPGSRPGAYGLKLIDYDGMYVPALANTPSGESGHPSYQHPARAKTRAYSPDVDRFPHLVVLTTLKALSVGGQALWEKYDNGDNLLFIEEDFRNPSASKVMRELWWMGQPAIQSLVGRLAIACVRPIPQTPWIDDLAPEGDPTPLDKETRQAATTALGLAQSVPASLQPERVPLPPEPANDGAAPPEPVMSWRPQTVDVEIVETQAEEVDVEIVEERQSARARKPKEQRRTKAKKSAVSPLMIGIGVLGLVAIVTGAILFSGKKQDPTNVSQADSQKERDKDKKPDTPEGKGPDAILPKPKDKGPDPTTPKPKDTTPDSTPDSTPPSPNPIGLVFKERQRFSIENVRPMYAHFDLEGRSIVLASNRRVAVLDPKNGSMREASKPSTSNLQLLVATLYDGKVCVGRMGEKELSVTDKNGNAAAPIPLPVLPAATGNEEPGSVFQASPSGRYIALGRRGKWVNALTSAERFPTPLRILDTNTGKECYSADWQSGSVIFNANETRMLLVNNFGRGEWFKLPGGEPDGDWKFGLPMAGWAFNVLYASHDAKVLMCNGFINDRPVRFLLNGDTGKVITVLADKGMHYGYQVSADGKLVVSLARGGSTPNNSEWFLNLFDGIRGTELSQIKLPATSVGSYMFVLAPDGRTVVVLDQQTPSNMIVYDVGTETGVAVTPKPPDPTTPIRSKPEVGTLKLRWEAELKNAPNSAIPYFDRDGTVLVLPSRGGSKTDGLSFNARTGKPGIELKAESLLPRVCPLEKGKIGFQHGSGATQFTVWDTTTGKTSATNFPAAGTGPQELTVSSNARYYAVISGAGRDVEAPYRIFDSKTSKAVVSMESRGAKTYFTPDASRALVRDNYDRYRWFKLPSGQLDGEWKYDRENGIWPGAILSMTPNGSVLLYHGRSPQQRADGHAYYLIDGKTGEQIHMFPLNWNVRTMSMSPEGDMVVVQRPAAGVSDNLLEVFDIKDTSIAKVVPEIPAGTRLTPSVAVSWEAHAIAIYDSESKKLCVYDLPGSSSASVVTRPKGREDGGRATVPDDAAIAKAEATIRQVLKDDYAKKTPADQKALAQKLLKLAGETTDDPVSRYVMLRDAREFAQGIADPTVTLQAIDSLAKWYQINGPAQQLASLEKILAATTIPATVKIVAEAATASAQAASDADELDEAVDFSQLAVNAVKKAKLTAPAIEEADTNLANAKKSRDAFAIIRPALEKLKSTPDDPASHTIVGKYRCFIQNRWEDGLKHISKGEDAVLRMVAELDLKAPRTGPIEDSKLAEAWWEYAQIAPADAQWAAQVRTRYWYGRCIPALTGLKKAQAEGRLAITVAGMEYRPGLLCEFTAKQVAVLKGKKARIDPIIDFSGGEFSDGAKQTDLTLKWTGALVPSRGGRYMLVAQTTDPVRVRVDGKIVIDTMIGGTSKREASVVLGEKVTPLVVDYSTPNTDRHRIKLAWIVPGGTAEEAIPADCLFHDKKIEAVLPK